MTKNTQKQMNFVNGTTCTSKVKSCSPLSVQPEALLLVHPEVEQAVFFPHPALAWSGNKIDVVIFHRTKKFAVPNRKVPIFPQNDALRYLSKSQNTSVVSSIEQREKIAYFIKDYSIKLIQTKSRSREKMQSVSQSRIWAIPLPSGAAARK